MNNVSLSFRTSVFCALLCSMVGLQGAPTQDKKGLLAVDDSIIHALSWQTDIQVRRDAPATLSRLRTFRDTHEAMTDHQYSRFLPRLLYAALKVSQADYEKEVKAWTVMPESQWKQRVRIHFIEKMCVTHPQEAERFMAVERRHLSATTMMNLYSQLGKHALWQREDEAGFARYYELLEAVDAPKKGARDRWSGWRRNFRNRMLDEYAQYSSKGMMKFLADRKASFSKQDEYAIQKSIIVAALMDKDRPLFDAEMETLRKLPDCKEKVDAWYAVITKILALPVSFLHRDLYRPLTLSLINELQTMKMGDRQRFDCLRLYSELYRIEWHDHGFNEPGRYDVYRKYATQALEFAREKSLKQDWNLRQFCYSSLRSALKFGDLTFAELPASFILSFKQSEATGDELLAEYYLRKGDQKQCLAWLEKLSKRNEKSKQLAHGISFLLKGGKASAVGLSDGVTSIRDRLELLRRVSRFLFRSLRYELVREIHDEITGHLFAPIEKKVYRVRYDADGPLTADAWSRSPAFADWSKMETRFVPYGDGYGENCTKDAQRHIKDAVPQKMDMRYRCGVYVSSSADGVHLFVRGDDPAMSEIQEGKRSGGTLEFHMRYGDDTVYRSWFLSDLPGSSDPYEVNWAAPSKDYHLTYDYLKKDAVATSVAMASHTFIPWLAVYKHLPVRGNSWYLGVQYWRPSGGVTLSGNVHELGRMVRLDFDLNEEQLKAIRRRLACQAYYRYKALRHDKEGKLLVWNDPKLGDPKFFREVMEPLFKQLDRAGETMVAQKTVDADMLKLVPLWAEIDYVVAEKRKEYLKRHLFEE